VTDPAGQLAALRTAAGEAVLSAAAELAGTDPLAAASALRAREIEPGWTALTGGDPDKRHRLAAAALTQAELRRRAEAKFGTDARRMFFTRPGLEQATRSAVASRRAARLAAAGVRTLADLGCGIGSDAIAAARAGIRVYAVDADPFTAAVASANVAALGLDHLVRVECRDATQVDLSDVDAVFCDPARRSGRTGRRIFEPPSYSPPWDFVAGLPARVPRTVLKLAPGIDHELIPAGAEAEWVSVGGDLVEATFWCGPLAEVPRRASLLPADHQLTGSGAARAPVGPVGRFVYDPDGAVVRAHLVAEFAATVDGVLADDSIAYVYASQAVQTPFARCFAVLDAIPFSVKRLRAALRERGVGRVEILKRGSAVDVEALRRDLRLAGDAAASVLLTRVSGAPTALLCTPTGR
jgi:SAM-dependent methyltransferase